MDVSSVAVRKMADDNSCLFNAIRHCLGEAQSLDLRRVVSSAVLQSPSEYSEAFLGMPTGEYARWILKPESWGGAIEMFVLSKHFKVTIVSCDVETGRFDRFGDYLRSIYLLYSGIHYDSIVGQLDPNLPESCDVSVFDSGSAASHVEALIGSLCRDAKRMNYYTNTATFTLVCGECSAVLVGQDEAVKHATATGHSNFSQVQ